MKNLKLAKLITLITFLSLTMALSPSESGIIIIEHGRTVVQVEPGQQGRKVTFSVKGCSDCKFKDIKITGTKNYNIVGTKSVPWDKRLPVGNYKITATIVDGNGNIIEPSHSQNFSVPQ